MNMNVDKKIKSEEKWFIDSRMGTYVGYGFYLIPEFRFLWP